MTPRPKLRPYAVPAASRQVEGSNSDGHALAKGQCNLCGKCTKVVDNLQPSTLNRWLDFGRDGEGYKVDWDVAGITDSAQNCDLCRILVEIFHFDQPTGTVSSGTINGNLADLGEHYILASDPPEAVPSSRPLSQVLRLVRRILSPEPSAPTSRPSTWRPDVRDRLHWTTVLGEVDEEFEDGRPRTYQSWTLGRRLMVSYDERRGQEVSWESESELAISKADYKREPGETPNDDVQETGAAGGGVDEAVAHARKENVRLIRQPQIFHSIQLARLDSSRSDPESSFFARRISSRRQNIPLIRSWLDRCLRNHEGNCQLSPEHRTVRSLSLRVIDVEARCIIKAPRRCRYIALSYVWGSATQVLLKTTTEEAFSRPGGLPEGIPATIEDAMALCRMLGERYLWVDALCIYQDPPSKDPSTDAEFGASAAAQKSKLLQIRNMDAIYAGAVLTIANAAASSADDPIPGVRSDAPHRGPPPSFPVGENTQVAATIAHAWEHVSLHSKWDTRGWTFQEKILSKRLLVVTEHFSFFRCPSGLWREDRFESDLFKETGEEKAQIWESEDVRGLYRPTPNRKRREQAREALSQYQKLVPMYLSRNLTYDQDTLLAFQGIQQTISPSVGGFFWGLPKKGFRGALTWNFTGQPKRREDFPSWSWAGWKGTGKDFTFKSGISKHYREDDGILFYQLIARKPVRRARGEPRSLADEAVDVCIINKFRFGDEHGRIAGVFGSLQDIWVPPRQNSPPAWKTVAERLDQDSYLLDRLDRLLVFYARTRRAGFSYTPESSVYDLGYWSPNERVAREMHASTSGHRLSRGDNSTTELRQRDWIVVQDNGGKYLKAMLIEWVGNVAYRVALEDRVMAQGFFGPAAQTKLIILG